MVVIIAIFGLLIGSFTNVLIGRFDALKSIAVGRSECPHCHHQLAWYDLIPLASFLILGGKCRYCKKKISWLYPVVELLVMFVAVQLYLMYGISVTSILLLPIFILLLAIAVIDMQHYVIPDAYMLPAIILAVVLTIFRPGIQWISELWGVLLAGGGLGLIVLLSRERWMGSGDIGLGILMGLLGGLFGTAIGIVFAFVSGSLVGIVLLLIKRKKPKDMIPFGPFLAVGTYIAALWGSQIMQWYLVKIGYF